jgi:anaerobic nitric oxide reductase transcription regulator
VLLALNEGYLVPIAVKGFGSDLLGRRFHPNEHPRLKAVLDSESPLGFGLDSALPNPFESAASTARVRLGLHSSNLYRTAKQVGLKVSRDSTRG